MKIGQKDSMGIRPKLLLHFMLFLILMLLVVWFFQIYMMEPIYERIKYREMKQTVSDISKVVGTEDLENEVYKAAMKTSTCIIVYRIDGGVLIEVASVEALNHCTIHYLSEQSLCDLVVKAKNNNGGYFTKLTFGGAEENGQVSESGGNATVSATLTPKVNGREYLILLNAELIPLNAMTQTLQYQYVWIAIAMLGVAVLLAFFLSRSLSKPLTRMSIAAQQLAVGDYEVDFAGEGYRETEELADALNYAAEELSKSDKLQKELLANISHDLRTPLTMIEGYGEVMRDIPGENTPENVQVIIEETQRLSELVTDLLDLSKLRAGTQKVNLTSVALTELIREVLRRYEKLTEHDGYRIQFDFCEDVMIKADRTMILQVVYNLINNAINYTGEDKTVHVMQRVRDGRVRVSVSDTGEGIDPEQIPMIWDRYYKVDRVHRRAMIGTGLGLSIVKGILELHGAAYGVESKRKKGSTFWFEFSLMSDETGFKKDGQYEK